ncbi:hypothetical protein CSB93_3284 [Pseudomonas paraeruginosa]|uniref:Uncharacterized protein n=1 Tax=Pseudomonas paraeruginosa TaxID=2994495 RepID=A0A2R3IWN9_9PSED|nr:hypothetical protein CSB93_3284 [Pseudomonas paraeruginosa]AWE91868.1 hypothetical protein CSC28_2061 [Pseudomonas paraeruginosa]PTC37673.1 hypothetical protein CLJ1_1828 [Pseudomonas aeruginosa]
MRIGNGGGHRGSPHRAKRVHGYAAASGALRDTGGGRYGDDSKERQGRAQ